MITLYGGAFSRAAIVQWFLEELQISYEFKSLDLKAQAHKDPAFLAINPMGKVPAITDGDLVLWESGAILLYLAEKYGDRVTTETRGLYAQWVLFANSTLSTGLFTPDIREKETPLLLAPLNRLLEHQLFFVGNEFSVADVAVASILQFAQMMLQFDYGNYEFIQTYLQGISDRPAFQKAILGR